MILTVLLTILKVIGWILLAILGLILLILLLVIFCPLKYQVKGHLHREIKESEADASGSWLFSAVGGGAVIENLKPEIYIRILKFRKYLGRDSEGEPRQPEDEESLDELAEEVLAEDEDIEVSLPRQPEDEDIEVSLPQLPEAGSKSQAETTEEQASETTGPEETEPEDEKGGAGSSEDASAASGRRSPIDRLRKKLQAIKKKPSGGETGKDSAEEPGNGKTGNLPGEDSDHARTDKSSGKKFTAEDLEALIGEILEKMDLASDKIDGIMDKVDAAIDTAEDKIDGLEDKIDALGQKLDKILDLVKDEGNQKAAAHLLREVWYILKSLLPYRMDADLTFSAGSPDLTGMLLGVLAVMPLTHRKKFQVYPDFDAEGFYAEGYLAIFGKICIYKILGALIRLLLDKNIRKVIKLALKLKKEKSK